MAGRQKKNKVHLAGGPC